MLTIQMDILQTTALASMLWLQPHAAVLQMLPPKDIPASSARKMLIREKVNQER